MAVSLKKEANRQQNRVTSHTLNREGKGGMRR